MTGAPDEGMAGGPSTLAAVIAAVQAYMDEEARLHGPPAARKLSPWKRASWQMSRGGLHSRSWLWRYRPERAMMNGAGSPDESGLPVV